jgi:hypothetical protein
MFRGGFEQEVMVFVMVDVQVLCDRCSLSSWMRGVGRMEVEICTAGC